MKTMLNTATRIVIGVPALMGYMVGCVFVFKYFLEAPRIQQLVTGVVTCAISFALIYLVTKREHRFQLLSVLCMPIYFTFWILTLEYCGIHEAKPVFSLFLTAVSVIVVGRILGILRPKSQDKTE